MTPQRDIAPSRSAGLAVSQSGVTRSDLREGLSLHGSSARSNRGPRVTTPCERPAQRAAGTESGSCARLSSLYNRACREFAPEGAAAGSLARCATPADSCSAKSRVAYAEGPCLDRVQRTREQRDSGEDRPDTSSVARFARGSSGIGPIPTSEAFHPPPRPVRPGGICGESRAASSQRSETGRMGGVNINCVLPRGPLRGPCRGPTALALKRVLPGSLRGSEGPGTPPGLRPYGAPLAPFWARARGRRSIR